MWGLFLRRWRRNRGVLLMDLIFDLAGFIRVAAVNAAENATVTTATRRQALTKYESLKVAVTSCGIIDVCFLCEGEESNRNMY